MAAIHLISRLLRSNHSKVSIELINLIYAIFV